MKVSRLSRILEKVRTCQPVKTARTHITVLTENDFTLCDYSLQPIHIMVGYGTFLEVCDAFCGVDKMRECFET